MLLLGTLVHALVAPLSAAFVPAAHGHYAHATSRFGIGIGTDSSLHASILSSDETISGSGLHYIDESVIQENIRVHQDAVRRSEELFYGYFSTDGISEWDVANMPSGYTHYSLHSGDTSSAIVELIDGPGAGPNANAGTTTVAEKVGSFSTLYESMLLELDRRTVPTPFTDDDLARVSLDPIRVILQTLEIEKRKSKIGK